MLYILFPLELMHWLYKKPLNIKLILDKSHNCKGIIELRG